MEIDKETYDQIAELIHSDESPVGIDAKKTHILILHKLADRNCHDDSEKIYFDVKDRITKDAAVIFLDLMRI